MKTLFETSSPAQLAATQLLHSVAAYFESKLQGSLSEQRLGQGPRSESEQVPGTAAVPTAQTATQQNISLAAMLSKVGKKET